MDPDEKEKQEKTLAKLQWLNERAKLDFRGNPSPFEVRKTLRSVAHEKRLRAHALAGDTDFLPFWHSTAPLALDATRSSYIQCDAAAAQPPCSTAERSAGFGAQATDPATGLTQIQLALSWDVPHPPPQQPVLHSGISDGGGGGRSRVVRDASYLRSLTAGERAAAYRTQMLEHPKCTWESSRKHHERWAASTQLSEPIAKPCQRGRNTALSRQNAVRAVHLLRST